MHLAATYLSQELVRTNTELNWDWIWDLDLAGSQEHASKWMLMCVLCVWMCKNKQLFADMFTISALKRDVVYVCVFFTGCL